MNPAQRERLPEWMDEEDLNETLHAQALDGLRRLNRISRSGPLLWNEIQDAAVSSPGPLRVLDVGCGGGDIATYLSLRGKSAIFVEGCDLRPFAVEYARRYAGQSAAVRTRFFQHDILEEPLPEQYDVVICSLFLHHFDESPAIEILDRMRKAARLRVIVLDLARTRQGYVLAWIACHLLSRSAVVHKDGPLSVAGAFSVGEIRTLARKANLKNVRIQKRWPQRFLLSADGR